MKYKLNLLINKMEKIFFHRRDNENIPLLSKLSMPLFIIILIVSFQNCRPKIERNILEFLNLFPRTNSAVTTINLNYPVTILDFTINASIMTQTPTFSGGSIVSCVSSPSLPLGLILNNTTCEITGTPTVMQAAINYTITASDSNFSTASANISITISANPPSVLTYVNNPFSFKVGQAVSNQIPTYTGTIVNCSVPSGPFLPAGLTIDNSCIISGTPTATQAATNHTILASNAFGSTNSTINITVVDVPPSNLVYSSTSYTFTQNVAITNQTPTFSGFVANCTANPTLPAGLFISGATCTISGTPTTTQVSTPYVITAANIYGTTNTTINIFIQIPPPSALTYPLTGNYTFILNAPISPVVTPTFSGTITSCTSNIPFPSGLSLSSQCVISGTPTVAFSSTGYTITATNSSGFTTANIVLAVTVNLNKRIFVTTGIFRPSVDFTFPSEADSLCNSDSAAPSGGTYKAMIVGNTAGNVRSASPTLQDWVLQPSTTYHLPDGINQLGVTNAVSLFNTTLFVNLTSSPTSYWTGLATDWSTSVSSNCSNWNTANNGQSGFVGNSNSTFTGTVISAGTATCDLGKSFLCVEQ